MRTAKTVIFKSSPPSETYSLAIGLAKTKNKIQTVPQKRMQLRDAQRPFSSIASAFFSPKSTPTSRVTASARPTAKSLEKSLRLVCTLIEVIARVPPWKMISLLSTMGRRIFPSRRRAFSVPQDNRESISFQSV